MDTLIIQGTESTPYVELNQDNGSIKFVGKSFSDSIHKFFEPILNWLDKYIESPCENTNVEFKMEYYNTSSSKILLVVLNKLEELERKSGNVSIKWFYEEDDEDMQESGEEYAEIIKVPFEIIECEEI